jgi:hypothetical protein
VCGVLRKPVDKVVLRALMKSCLDMACGSNPAND